MSAKRDKHIEELEKNNADLEEKNEYILAMVARFFGSEGVLKESDGTQYPIKRNRGEDVPREPEAIQNPFKRSRDEDLLRELEVIQDSAEKSRVEGVPIENEATQNLSERFWGKCRPTELEASQRLKHSCEPRLGNLKSRVVQLEAVASHVGEIVEKLSPLRLVIINLAGIVDEFKNDVKESINDIYNELQFLKSEVKVLMRVISKPTPKAYGLTKSKVLEPKAFGEVRDAKEVENFLFDMELFFNVTKRNYEEEKLDIVPLYLIDDTKLRWRNRVTDTRGCQCMINSWDVFKKELKAQFYLKNVSLNARWKLVELQQIGLVQDYIREFLALMLNIKNMNEDDKFHNFMKGLKSWLKMS